MAFHKTCGFSGLQGLRALVTGVEVGIISWVAWHTHRELIRGDLGGIPGSEGFSGVPRWNVMRVVPFDG